MIRHTVVFSLVHARASQEEAAFLTEARVLAGIPGVTRFEQLAQVSPKSAFTHGFSMEFAGPREYAAYDAHPDHVTFVRDRWVPEVTDFAELDFELLDAAAPSGAQR